MIDPEISNKSKTSLGYNVCFSSNPRVMPTGREWVFTASDEQIELLYEIERMVAGFGSMDYRYVFCEHHGSDFDGWVAWAHNQRTKKTLVSFHEGFPASVVEVKSAFFDLFHDDRNADE